MKKKGIRSQGPFPLFFFYQNGKPSCKERKQLSVSLRRPGSADKAQFFSVFRSNGGTRDATVKWGGVKITRKTPVPRRTGAIFCVFPTNRGKQEANTKSESRTKRGVQKKKDKTSCTLYLHQLFKLFSPQTLAETTTNMVLCRANIFSKEMTVTSKHMLLCERNL